MDIPQAFQFRLSRSLFIVIMLFMSLAQITADMYTPSLPFIAHDLKSSPSTIQMTLSIYMLGFSLSHLYYGPLSDRIGRRSPILQGISLCMIGSLFCVFAPSIVFIMLGRLIQGLGMGACGSVGRPLLRDILSGGQLAKLGSNMGMINVFVVASAPALGGYLQHYLGWRAIFFALFIYSSFVFLLTWKWLPESNFHLNPHATKLNFLIKNYRTVLTNKTFLGYSLCSSFSFAGLIAYATVAPFLLQSVVGLTPVQFGWLSFLIACSLFISMYLNTLFILQKGIAAMVLTGVVMMLLGGLLMIMFTLPGWINTFVIMLPVFFFAMGAGFTFANSFAGAFHPFPNMAGSAGALYGCLQIFGASVISALIALLPIHNQTPLALVFLALGLLSLLAFKRLVTNYTY